MATKQLLMEVQPVLNGGIAAQLHHAVQTILPLPSSSALDPPFLSFPCSVLSPQLSLKLNKQK